MRWVTRKPPKILTETSTRATKPKPVASPEAEMPTASSAPTTITEEIGNAVRLTQGGKVVNERLVGN